MSMPPAQAKIKYKKGKTEITYESNLDATQYAVFELARAGLRDAAKFLCKKFQEEYYKRFKKRTGKGGRVTKFKVFSNKNTIYPRVDIGLPHSSKGKDVEGFYAYFQEFGTSTGIPKLGLLTKTVQNNVATIVKLESQYLSGLSEEADRLARMIDENEFDGGADED